MCDKLIEVDYPSAGGFKIIINFTDFTIGYKQIRQRIKLYTIYN